MKLSLMHRCAHFVVGLILIAAGVCMGISWWFGDDATYWTIAVPTFVMVAAVHLYERHLSRLAPSPVAESEINSEQRLP